MFNETIASPPAVRRVYVYTCLCASSAAPPGAEAEFSIPDGLVQAAGEVIAGKVLISPPFGPQNNICQNVSFDFTLDCPHHCLTRVYKHTHTHTHRLVAHAHTGPELPPCLCWNGKKNHEPDVRFFFSSFMVWPLHTFHSWTWQLDWKWKHGGEAL